MAKLGQYQTLCKRGHLREGDNLLITPGGQRVCRKCMKIRWLGYEQSDHGKRKRKEIADRFRENNRVVLTERRRERVKNAQEFVNAIKSGPCMDCGNKYPTCAMDLDHVKGIKKDDLSGLIGSGSTLRILMEEIDKCELVCANCHRVRTYKRRQPNGS